jgi:5-methylcytosine-specific restriction endonuclease McrA
MKIKLKPITVREIIKNYKDSAEEGVVGFDGKLNIRPAYQREFVYKDEQRNEVIRTVMRGYPSTAFPLNVMYWAKTDENHFELIDGQQRTISLCQYANNEFSIIIDGMPKNFDNLSPEKKDYFLNYELQVYVCSGTPEQRLEWFSIINIAGEPLTPQELLNANYTGLWLSSAKRYFMKSNSAAYGLANKYIDIEANQSRGKGLETAIRWISKDNIKQYMADHQNDENADALWSHFRKVIEWVQNIFTDYYREMKGINWGQLYDTYNKQKFDPQEISKKIQELHGDLYVKNSKGIFEYVLGGSNNTKLLDIRMFDDPIKRSVYALQTKSSKAKGKSNCPDCAMGHDANKNQIWDLNEMEADHVSAWSKGGATNAKNCEMLCIRHNRAKGNR